MSSVTSELTISDVTGKSFAVILTNTKNFKKGLINSHETGFDVRELAYVWQLHKKGKANLVFASPRGGECHMDPNSRKEAEQDSIVREFLQDSEAMQMVRNTKRISDLTEQTAHCAILIGGHGCLFDFPECSELAQLLQRVWYQSQGMIAAIAQGTIGLVNFKSQSGQEPFLKNKRITCSSDEEEQKFRNELPFLVEDKLESVGAQVQTSAPNEVNVIVTENRLITAQNSQSSKKFVMTICDQMKHYH